MSLGPFLDLSSVVACGVEWDLASSSLGWPVVPAVFIEYLPPHAFMEYHLRGILECCMFTDGLLGVLLSH